MFEGRGRVAGSNYHPVWVAFLDLLQLRTSPSSVLMSPYAETCCSQRKEGGQSDLKGKKLKNRSGGVAEAKTGRLHRGAWGVERIRMKEHPRNGYSVALISNYFQAGSVGKGIIFHLCSRPISRTYFHKYLRKRDLFSVWCSSFWDRNHYGGTGSQFILEAA